MNAIEAKSNRRGFPKTSSRWQLRRQSLSFGRRPILMGIVNATPDSFSDGGEFLDPQRAVDRALQLIDDGAGIIDIGGESTRPYAEIVDEATERNRVIPVIENLSQQTNIPISIDTSKATIARAALEAGAEIINDITGLQGDPEMVGVAAESNAGVCAMHMQGTPQTMQDAPHYHDVVNEILQYLKRRRDELRDAGVGPHRICLDPGIGFGKTHPHNLRLLAECERFHELQCPILVGHSRKGFIGHVLGDKNADRDIGTLAITLHLAQLGVQIIRLHEVAATRQALDLLESVNALGAS